MSLVRAETCTLVVIDVQERLASAMMPDIRRGIVSEIQVLLRAADELAVPVAVTEQYPKGLGRTLSEVSRYLPGQAAVVDKDSFSSCDEPTFSETLRRAARSQIVLTGMETHVCILQTAVQLQEGGYTPIVVADAVCSRRPEHKANALDRLRTEGVTVANGESVLFEWLRCAGTESFRRLSRLVR